MYVTKILKTRQKTNRQRVSFDKYKKRSCCRDSPALQQQSCMEGHSGSFNVVDTSRKIGNNVLLVI